jgi:hypothetical protein
MRLRLSVTCHQRIHRGGGWGADLTHGPIHSLVTDEYVGPQGAPRLTHDPYIRQLIDKYKRFIFLLLPVLAVSLDGESLK